MGIGIYVLLAGLAWVLWDELKTKGGQKHERDDQVRGDRIDSGLDSVKHRFRQKPDGTRSVRGNDNVYERELGAVGRSPGDNRGGEQGGDVAIPGSAETLTNGGDNEDVSQNGLGNNGSDVSGEPSGGNEPDSAKAIEGNDSDTSAVKERDNGFERVKGGNDHATGSKKTKTAGKR